MIALKIAVYFALILAVAKPLGVYMARLFTRAELGPCARPRRR